MLLSGTLSLRCCQSCDCWPITRLLRLLLLNNAAFGVGDLIDGFEWLKSLVATVKWNSTAGVFPSVIDRGSHGLNLGASQGHFSLFIATLMIIVIFRRRGEEVIPVPEESLCR